MIQKCINLKTKNKMDSIKKIDREKKQLIKQNIYF